MARRPTWRALLAASAICALLSCFGLASTVADTMAMIRGSGPNVTADLRSKMLWVAVGQASIFATATWLITYFGFVRRSAPARGLRDFLVLLGIALVILGGGAAVLEAPGWRW